MIYANSSMSQSDELIKLDSLLNISKNSENYWKALDNIIMYCDSVDIVSGIDYVNLYLTEGLKYPNSEKEAKAKMYSAIIYYHNGVKTDTIEILASQSLEISKNLNYTYGIIQSSYTLAMYYRRVGDFTKAVEYYLAVIEYSEALKDEEYYLHKIGQAYHGLGVTFDYQKNSNKAIEYFEKSNQIAIELSNKDLQFVSLESLGIVNAVSGNLKIASKFFFQALQSVSQNSTDDIRRCNVLGNISQVYNLQGKIDSAEIFALRSIEIAKKIDNPRFHISSLGSIIKLYKQSNQLTKLKNALNQRTAYLEEMNEARWWRTHYQDYVDYYTIKEDWKNAFYNQLEYNAINDSILNESNQRNILELEQKFATEQKEKKIMQQSLELSLIEKEKIQLLLGSLFAIGLLILVITTILQKQKTKKIITEKNAIIQSQRIQDLEKEKKILSIASMIEGQESERIRIAKDLHDGLGSLLVTIKTHFSQIQKSIDDLSKFNPYKKANDMIDDACQEVRRISHNLLPDILRLEGLQAGIESHAEQIEESSGIDINLNFNILDIQLSEIQELFLLRIFQELCNNTLKHANASLIKFSAISHHKHLQCIYQDNGIGFNQQEVQLGIGLNSIQSRVDYLNGKLDLSQTKLNTGAKISIEIPL